MAWVYEKYPDPLSPGYPLLLETGALHPKHELTAMRWCRLHASPFRPLGGHPVLEPIYRAVLKRVHVLEHGYLDDLRGGKPLILEARYLDPEAKRDLDLTCTRLAAFLAEIEAPPAGEPPGERRQIFEWLLAWGKLARSHEPTLRTWAALTSGQQQALYHGTPSRFLRRPANLNTLLMPVRGYQLRAWSSDRRTLEELDGDCVDLAERLATRPALPG